MNILSSEIQSEGKDEQGQAVKRADPDIEPINIFEEYRRAKKNSMLWSSISFLVATGVTWPRAGKALPEDQPITLSWVGTGIGFPSWLIVAAFAVTAMYMWLSWVWADRRLVLANSPLLFEKSISDLSQVLSDLAQQIEVHRAAIAASYREHIESEVAFESLFKRNKSFLVAENEYIQKISELDQAVNEYVSRVNFVTTEKDESLSIALIRQNISGILHDLREIANKKQKRVDLSKKRNKDIQYRIDQNSEKLRLEIANFNEIGYDLVGFHQSIGVSERIRIFMLDYVPVNAIFLLAMASSAICGVYLAGASIGS